jgi:hypothetical protein
VKRTTGKLITGIFAMALLLGGFGVFQSSALAQATATMAVTPSSATDVAAENTRICAKCGSTDAQFKISVTHSAANTETGKVETVAVEVKNLDLGTLSSKQFPDSNAKTITLIETGANTGVFERVVTSVNLTTGLVSDMNPDSDTGAAVGDLNTAVVFTAASGATTTVLTDANARDTANSGKVSVKDGDNMVGGTILMLTGPAAGETRALTGYTDTSGAIAVSAFTGTPTSGGGDTYRLFPKATVGVFTGQTLQVSYAAASLGQSPKTIVNDEVKPSVVRTAPEVSTITKKGQTITFSVDITDVGAGFPAKAADVVDNNTAGTKGRMQLFVGNAAVSLASSAYTAITGGYRMNASFSSTAIASLSSSSGKVIWWVEVEDLAGNVQQLSDSISATSTGAGADTGTTVVDAAIANMATGAFITPSGKERYATITIGGLDQTRKIDGYTAGSGTLTFSADATGKSTDRFTRADITGTVVATASSTTFSAPGFSGLKANEVIGGRITAPTGASDALETLAVTAYTDNSPSTGQATITAAFSNQPAQNEAYTLSKVGFQVPSGTKYLIRKAGLITVDGDKPVFSAAVTGENWNSGSSAGARLKTGLNAKDTAIRITFTDNTGLDSATVVPAAIAVAGNTVSSVLLVDVVGENVTPAVARQPVDIFVTLGTGLLSSARPNVTIASTVKDKAGNAFGGTTVKPTDKLGPKLAVSLDNTLSKKQVKATIASDELLVAAPTIATKVMTSTTAGTLGTVPGTAPSTTGVQTGIMGYSHTVKIASLGANAGRKYNIYVTGSDTGSNPSSTGHSTDGTKSSAITFELDQWLNNGNPPKVSISDKVAKAIITGGSVAVPKVEAVDPLIVTVDFNLGCTVSGSTQTCATAGEVNEYIRDSNKTVTMTAASIKMTFKDNTTETITYDVATQVSTPDNKRFTIAILSPKVAKYTMTVKAEDAAGNNALKNPLATSAQSLKYDWEVTAPSPVSVKLSPGWNMISLPFAPANPAINSVISATHPISLVMTYDQVSQVWMVSRRDAATGLFTGDVAVIVSTSAYFVNTTSFEPLKLLRPPLATAAAAPPAPPAITVKTGWNMVPVASNVVPLPTSIDGDTYFATLGTNWLKALAWNPLTRVWMSVAPKQVAFTSTASYASESFTDRCGKAYAAGSFTATGQTVKAPVCTGQGMWLWVTKDGVLIP